MNIIVIDDDIFVTMSLKTILESNEEIKVIATGSSGKDGISLYEKHFPDLLLMDIRMKEMSGLDATKVIMEKYPDAKILLLTTFLDDEYIVKAIKYGAKGYLLKQNFASIAPSIEAVIQGQTVFGEDIMAKLPSLLSAASEPDHGDDHWKSYGITKRSDAF